MDFPESYQTEVDADGILFEGGSLLTALNRLIRSAAFAADCIAAVFYTVANGSAQVAASFDALGYLRLEPGWWPTAEAVIPPSGVLVIDDLSAPGLPGAALGLPADSQARFLAAVRVCRTDGTTCGVLIVGDHKPHAGLSAAQAYVFSTHGLQINTLLRSHDIGPGPGPAVDAERLRLLESVVVHANDAVLITEAAPVHRPGPRIVYCNAAFTKTTGYTMAEVLGRTPRILQSPNVDQESLARLRQALERWEPVEVELLNVHKDGTEFWIELSIVPVADEFGWFTHWVSVQRDITGRKRAEEAAIRARIAEIENRALETEIQRRKQTEKRLLFAAYHDDLTRLRNRCYLMDRLTSLLGRGAAPRCAVLFLDLDRFKLVNDSLGHRAGDLMLMEAARRLQACVRPSDTLARVGGDEFAVLIEDADDLATAVPVARRILESLRQPFKLGQHEVFSSCSIGIAFATCNHMTPEELLRDADIAMYDAKQRGAGGHAIFNAAMHADVVEALTLQTDLRRAIGRQGTPDTMFPDAVFEEFRLHYQPIFNPMTGGLIGAEALTRWSHPDRGLVQPAAFIPVAEEIGVIRDIGRWVLREACDQMRAWQCVHGVAGMYISVNVSADELRDSAFVPELRAVLRATGLAPRCLQLEITESVFLQQPEGVGAVLKRLRTLGVRIALDDFGTGYSSLGYLDRYRIDTVKIDRSFIARMLRQRRAMSIMDGIMKLGTALDLDIVAEGVETSGQLRTLVGMGCGGIQGFLMGRPLPAASMETILSRDRGKTA